MKNIVFICFLTLFFSCEASTNLVEEADIRDISGFHSVKVGGGIDVHLTQGKEFFVNVEAEKGDIERVITELQGETLNIYYEGRGLFSFNTNQIEVHITMPSIKSLTSSGGSDIFGKNVIRSSELKLHSSGGSDIKMKVECNELVIHSSGGADVHIEGNTNYLEANSSGGSDIHGYDLTANIAILESSGGSDIRITVLEEIMANASGGSDISYRGDPEKVDVNSSGGGDVHHR